MKYDNYKEGRLPVKALSSVLAVVGIIVLVWAVIGRFCVGAPTVLGFQAINVVIGANSLFLLAIICKLAGK